jgi:Asp-tRNA(Asn)/Glu-tRNA(Gln) amidotransferase A subunit family amidase
MDVKGYYTTLGTKFLGDLKGKATSDAPPVAKLRALGAIIIGGANMHEIGIGPTGHNAHFQSARNPYNLHHYTGGSSSGSAAAVMSGMVPVALAADGGG